MFKIGLMQSDNYWKCENIVGIYLHVLGMPFGAYLLDRS